MVAPTSLAQLVAPASLAHTLLLTEAKNLLGLGCNADGQLGIGTKRDALKPTRVTGLTSMRVCAIACGGRHSLVATEAGLLYAFGNNDAGQLGLGSRGDAMVGVAIGVQNRKTLEK